MSKALTVDPAAHGTEKIGLAKMLKKPGRISKAGAVTGTDPLHIELLQFHGNTILQRA